MTPDVETAASDAHSRAASHIVATLLMIVFAFGFVVSAASASIIEGGKGLVFGTNYSYSLKAPKGWMLDNESAVQQGVHAVFYPKGSQWDDSVIVAYARSRPRTDTVNTADEAAEYLIKDFRANGNPNYAGKRIKTIKTDAGREAVIYHFTGDQWSNSEAVAYFVEALTINFVVLSSRDRKTFARSLPAFDALAKSYRFMGERAPAIDKTGGKSTPAAEKTIP
jgi:hypothetical protein